MNAFWYVVWQLQNHCITWNIYPQTNSNLSYLKMAILK